MSELFISEAMIAHLRDSLKGELEAGKMSEKRYRHTCEVEKMAHRLGDIYCPDKKNVLSAASLLHDITKEYSNEQHLEIFRSHSVELGQVDMAAPKVWHAMSASLIIPEKYPELATKEVIDAVRWHTTGRVGMSLTERIIYLADYIDMSRTFPDCVKLRELFFCDGLENMSYEKKLSHLDDVMLLSFDMTIRALVDEARPISEDTVGARNELALKRIQSRNK